MVVNMPGFRWPLNSSKAPALMRFARRQMHLFSSKVVSPFAKSQVEDKKAPEDRAVMVAREITEFVKRAEQPEPDRPWVVGVAINTGQAIVGYLGTRERAEFNVLGDLIKMAYRMQEYAVPNRICVGASTAGA